jgi:hypothetical protein
MALSATLKKVNKIDDFFYFSYVRVHAHIIVMKIFYGLAFNDDVDEIIYHYIRFTLKEHKIHLLKGCPSKMRKLRPWA